MTRSALRHLLCASVSLAACGGPGETAWPVDGMAAPGSPLPGLTAEQVARFEEGRRWFDHGFTPEEGLGPLYNQDRCSSCHDLPTIGGHGAERIPKASRWNPVSSQCEALDERGGAIVIQRQVTDEYRAAGGGPENIPPGATHFAEFQPLPTYGAGLIEAVPESEILSRADPDDADGDGISGRVARDAMGRLGRFGRRGVANLREFVAGGMVLEMGMTSSVFMKENSIVGQPLPEDADQVQDPELSDSTLALLIDFVRFLALPVREEATGAAADTILAGERAFFQVGCALCHVPTLRTGSNEVAALNNKVVWLWSDLLLHDMGPENESVCSGNAGLSEFRTTPLAGLRLRQPYMYNGQAEDLVGSIDMHGGEGAASRAAFYGLDESDRLALLRFLRSL